MITKFKLFLESNNSDLFFSNYGLYDITTTIGDDIRIEYIIKDKITLSKISDLYHSILDYKNTYYVDYKYYFRNYSDIMDNQVLEFILLK